MTGRFGTRATALMFGLAATGAITATALAAPAFDKEGKLVIPADRLSWPVVGVTYALSYEGDVGGQTFNTVRMDPKSYAAYLKTGAFPKGTMLDLEIRRNAGEIGFARDGHVQGAAVGGSVHVKDEKAGPGAWTFYGFTPDGKGRPIPREANCYSCHEEHAAKDTAFTQYYPALEEARAKVAAKR
jgi:hypothetical protein